MKKNIVLIASLLAFAGALLLTRIYFSSREADIMRQEAELKARYGEVWVLCYKRDTAPGCVLTKDDLQEMKVLGNALQGQALTRNDLADILGRKTTVFHREHEVVFWSDIEGGDPTAKGLSYDIKRSMRAVSINCSGSASVSSMVRPNDHVDVIGTFDFEGAPGKKSLVTCTILQNVLVLATGTETAKTRGRNLGAYGDYSTVTLEVTPREAEMLAFAEQIKGRLVLALRNRNDTSSVDELPSVDFNKIRSEIEELNGLRQREKLYSGR